MVKRWWHILILACCSVFISAAVIPVSLSAEPAHKTSSEPTALEQYPFNCTALIAGRGTTVDGSIFFAKTEDDSFEDIDFLWYIPRRQHAPRSVVKLQNGGEIPQVAETYAYFWDQNPGTPFSNSVVNEWGVALGSNACPSREDDVETVTARGDIIDGGLAFELRIILAERAKTAREAVEIAAELLDTCGYNASGRCLHIVGPNEAWQLQMVRGKQYVARRVRDEEVAIVANTYSIREVDPGDTENFVCSPRLIEYATERGWYDPANGKPFDFAAAYASPRMHTIWVNTDRQWNMARLLQKDFPITWQEARTGVMPVSVRPDRKLTVKDCMDIVRNHYEGTPLDSTDSYAISPHLARFRPICCNATHRTTIVQQRSWLPREIGTVVWRALEPPCASVFVPWYLGATRIPAAFQMAPLRADTTSRRRVDFHFNMPPETWRLGLESSGAMFKLFSNIVDGDYKEAIGLVRKTWDEFEAREFELQPVVDETALRLYEKDKPIALEYLTLYTNALAQASFEAARELIEKLPQTAGVLTAYGLYHFDLGEFDEAIGKFEQALTKKPDDADAKRYAEWTRVQKRIENESPTVSLELLERYAGDYGPRRITSRDGALHYQRDGGREFRLVPITRNTFALSGYRKFRLRFVAGGEGKIVKVVGLYFDGRTDESLRSP